MMSEPSFGPVGPGQASAGPGDPQASAARLSAVFVAILFGSALVGLAGGAIWAQLAPRAVYVTAGGGQAYVVNPETSAFIAGDAWYCLVGAVGGLIIGVVGYLFAVRRYGPVPMAAVLAGSIVAGLAARWVGQNWGLARFNSQLATARPGTLLHAPLVLGGDTSPLFWTSRLFWPAIVFWPLTACLLAGGFALAAALRSGRTTATDPWQAGWPAAAHPASPLGQSASQVDPAGPRSQPEPGRRRVDGTDDRGARRP